MHQYLNIEPDEALLGRLPPGIRAETGDEVLHNQPLAGMIATFHENERPLQGLAGLLDWRFHGAVSSFLRAGVLRGQPGECAYVPLPRGDGTFHLILVGAGCSRQPGERQKLDASYLQTLRSNLRKLKLQRLGISRGDFGQVNEPYFARELPDIPLCIIL